MRLLLALVLLFGSAAGWAETLGGVVIIVIDGDTVVFKPDAYSTASRAFFKVRLVDIDAPERAQPYGEAAKDALAAMALKRRAQLEIVGVDIYGRKLGRLSVDGLAVNAELVRLGAAWASSRDPDDPVRRLQEAARRGGAGLWRDAAPAPPWIWRRAQAAASD